MTNNDHSEAVIFDNRDIARYGEGERRMPMRGFDPEYTDIIDYIIRITHRIWEERAVGYIYDTYQHNSVVHGSGGSIHGREIVVANTIQSLAMYSDERAYGEDVIWTGNENDGFHTSHRLTGVAHHTGHSAYGPPSGRKIVWHTIANCLAKENMIFEEWLLNDATSVIRQMGYDLYTIVERQARERLERGVTPEPAAELGRTLGQYAPAPLPQRMSTQFDVEDFIRMTYHEIWNRRMFNTIVQRYAPAHLCLSSGARRLYGPHELINWIITFLAMFPDAGLGLDHIYWNGDDTRGYRVATRWTLTGTHTGYGVYGSPSGARIRIMGLSHHHIKNGVFHKEYTLFDEMELLRCIATQRLSRAV